MAVPDPIRLRPCVDCGGTDLSVDPPVYPGETLAYVRCLGCGTSVMGDTVERAVWIWNLPRPTVPALLQ